MREIAVRQNFHIVVTDTFSHAKDTDEMLPIPPKAQKLCDSVYILYKDAIDGSNIDDPTAYMLKFKKIK